MALKYTPEQSAAIKSRGKVIVSASAGSGKTFVMIQKLCDLIENGGDLDEVLAVTFTKKAAAQMKEKLRKGLVSRLATAEGEARLNIKAQLNKIHSADISTIHSFCARLVRTYFYVVDVDSAFDIIAADDSAAQTLKRRAMDNLFDRLYETDDADFAYVLSCLKRNRSDESVKNLIFEAHSAARNVADYEKMLANVEFSGQSFDALCAEYKSNVNERCTALKNAVISFSEEFTIPEGCEKLKNILEEMLSALDEVIATDDLFAPLPPINKTRRPSAKEHTREALDTFDKFRTKIKKKYEGLTSDLSDRQTELDSYLESGRLCRAFCSLVLQFDGEYTAVKRDEGKLDYNDLEHLTLRLLQNGEIKSRINSKYKHVFVDEYQDVNPVQERIISETGAENVFTVGDVKQAIYGFRGSKSVFFSRKYEDMKKDMGALRLSNNFRSSDGVLDFVNRLFADVMTPAVCGFSYREDGEMFRGGKYPEGCGIANIHIFGKEEKEKEGASGIYSVAERSTEKTGHTREGLAVLEIVKRELSSKIFDADLGCERDAQPGDICILTRKRADRSVTGIVRALTDAGYFVAGAKEANLCSRPEVRQMLDILSLIDNCRQDIPLSTALLSPLGNLSPDELAQVRIAAPRAGRLPFRECMVGYAKTHTDNISRKLSLFFAKINRYRRLSDVLGAAELIDRILSDTGLAARYSAEGGAKLAGLRRLAAEAYGGSGQLSLSEFLSKIKAGGYNIPAPVPSSSESIKVMTMHSSKGLEFPIVIIADIAASFKGREYGDMPFDDEYGFAPKCYNVEEKLQRTTILRRLCAIRRKRENVKNELNLFYVACTRAMCNLHVMCSEAPEYDCSDPFSADSYAKLFNVAAYSPEYMSGLTDFDGEEGVKVLLSSPDEEVYEKISSRFMRPYVHEDSVNLPVKSSASQLLRDSEEYYAEHELYAQEREDERETGAERGTAYHRYLELCDFAVKDSDGIRAQIDGFVANGAMPPEQAELLSVENLEKILAMPAFARLGGATLYREQEFLCRLPANAILNTQAEDGVLVQGAIDLLAIGADGTAIIDYKYSHKNDGQIKSFYSAQLALYKKAVARILKIDESTISTTVINIFTLSEIKMEV
ncbi:MAG: UvrD-helicase domain-containing protein [Candidatus Coproplasma sp.]